MPRLVVLTRGAQQVAAQLGIVDPVSATLWGLARTVALEFAQCDPLSLDLDPELSAAEALADLDLGLLTGPEREDQLALRGQRIFGRRLQRIDPSAVAPAKTLDRDGSYLITGGLGSLGLRIAEWLVHVARVRCVVLSSRSEPVADAKRQLVGLRQPGCRVEHVAADVAEEQAVRDIFESLDRLPSLRGIVHCAEVLADGVLANPGWDDFERSLRAKVLGAWMLHRHSHVTGYRELP